ncbi:MULTISPECIES: hypothetical protein [Streptomyces]|uniref:Uncharacterized protein n=1 Tax=Streptomyces xinghaiensis TaxID=1038928 RepID=A0A3R7FIJ3_9ACTN|nr:MULTISPECIES: hypothetical protein [Streptomyces]PQM22742.1 hypothetical protein Sfr7A_13570 [Streptomyces xinghaiensis]RKM97911.1 hypothetical protein SFRA_005005 [Streptomyces xinghaiensis]RNC73952.1 hypothetical protein DC095_013975 [Streptomyces xinghaiensis]
MHCDVHLRLHELRAAELRREAGAALLLPEPPPGPGPRSGAGSATGDRAGPRAPLPLRLRSRVGWTLVEVGLHLLQQPKKRLGTGLPRG